MKFQPFLLTFVAGLAHVMATPTGTGYTAHATSADHGVHFPWLAPLMPAAVPNPIYRVSGRAADVDASVPYLPPSLSGLGKFLEENKGKGKKCPTSSTKPATTTSPSIENGIKENKSCEPLTLIFARGTEEEGNMGTVVGPALATAFRKILTNKITVQGVDYPATPAGTFDLGTDGGQIMADLVEQALLQCPSTKAVVAGYSQGAMVLHDAAEILGNKDVTAAVVFGDPLKYLPLDIVPSGYLREFCAPGDIVCGKGDDVSIHKSYGANADEAAQFIVMAAGIQ